MTLVEVALDSVVCSVVGRCRIVVEWLQDVWSQVSFTYTDSHFATGCAITPRHIEDGVVLLQEEGSGVDGGGSIQRASVLEDTEIASIRIVKDGSIDQEVTQKMRGERCSIDVSTVDLGSECQGRDYLSLVNLWAFLVELASHLIAKQLKVVVVFWLSITAKNTQYAIEISLGDVNEGIPGFDEDFVRGSKSEGIDLCFFRSSSMDWELEDSCPQLYRPRLSIDCVEHDPRPASLLLIFKTTRVIRSNLHKRWGLLLWFGNVDRHNDLFDMILVQKIEQQTVWFHKPVFVNVVCYCVRCEAKIPIDLVGCESGRFELLDSENGSVDHIELSQVSWECHVSSCVVSKAWQLVHHETIGVAGSVAVLVKVGILHIDLFLDLRFLGFDNHVLLNVIWILDKARFA